jgi:hypothetical protein
MASLRKISLAPEGFAEIPRSPYLPGDGSGGGIATPEIIYLDGESLMPETLMRIDVESRLKVMLTETAWARIRHGAQVVADAISEGRVMYGINTGFGRMANVIIPPERTAELQVNLIRSHAAGAYARLRCPRCVSFNTRACVVQAPGGRCRRTGCGGCSRCGSTCSRRGTRGSARRPSSRCSSASTSAASGVRARVCAYACV